MKILWIVNTPIDIIGEKLYGIKENGVWMDALISECRKNKTFDLIVATTAKVKKTISFERDGITFYVLPDNVPILYNERKPTNLAVWLDFIKNQGPDVIQIWGAESSPGLCAIKTGKQLGIPSVIYMQGYLGSIARYYLAGISEKEIWNNLTFRDILKRDSILQQQKKYLFQSKREAEEISLAGRIICENVWCEQSVKSISPDVRIYNCPLSINKVFGEVKWDIEHCEKHSIICNASGYPLKGLHMMLRAVALLKHKYPDIKLYVPGEKMIGSKSFVWQLRRRGYKKYIENLVKKLGISENIVWLGLLTQDKLAIQYAKANVFVLCSAIENHSSSLKEAMMVGTPCVASAVGGVPEYVRHGENGFLYRFEEYDIAAAYIEKIFESDKLASNLSNAARNDMVNLHSNNDIFERTTQIYRDILKEES